MRLALILAATALSASAAAAQKEAASPEAKALLESCAARKFETTVEVTVDGKKRASKVKLCGKEGQTDAEWANTLKDAAAKVAANDKMPQAAKDQVTAALNAEIAKIEAAMVVANAPLIAIQPSERPAEYSVLPPLPTPPAAAVVSGYSALPPLPAAPKVATAAAAARPAVPLRKPRLTFRCYTPGDIGGDGPCLALQRETILTVRADEHLGGAASLRFLRRGDIRGEVALAQMRRGQSRRFKLPLELCTGVAGSKVEIQVVGGSNQVVDTLGPYQLSC